LEHATDAIPVLTPEGDLILAGGITNSNYKPLASVWRYPFGSHNQEAGMEHGTDTRGDTFSYLNVKRAGPVWLWALVAVLLIVFVAYIIYIRRGRRVAESPQTPGYAPMMEQVCQFLEEDKRYLKNVRQSDVATTLGVDVATLADCIRISRGCTFAQLIAEYRVRHAQQLISDNPQLKLAVVIAESGFTSESTFFRTFKAVTGKTPKEWLSDNT